VRYILRMWRARRPWPVLPAAIAVIVLLLATLGTLQYRWAGELSEAERARLRASARTRVEAMGRDFDTEISRAFRELEMDRATVRARDFGGWTARFEAWQREARWPRMVRAVYLVERDASGNRLARYVPGGREFVAQDWPLELTPIRGRLAGDAEGRGRGMFQPIEEAVPALVMLAFDRDRRGPGGPPGPPPTDVPFVVAVLDMDVIRAEVMPALAERHFGGPDGLDHDLRLVRQRERSATLWSSTPMGTSLPRVDAAAGLLELRGEHGPPGLRGGPGFPARAYGEDSGRWRLEVANRAGPLDDVVAAARRRNLAVGFGILVLLLAAVSLVALSAARAQRLGERQMRFLAAVSHELRTPVSVIRSTSENLADGVVKDMEHARVYGEVMRDESRRLGEMIEDVLAFAGASAPDRTRRQDDVPVAALVDDTLAALAATLHARDFTVERDLAPGLPAVRGDAAKLRHALQNLVENAMKYDGGRRWVAVRAAFDEAADEVVLSVVDRGHGIPALDLPHVFEPFYRGREAEERQIHGFGLGLALVRRTVQDHGGTVSVASTPGCGATFTVRLPAARGARVVMADGVDGLPNPSV